MRRLTAVISFALVLAACGGDGSSPSSDAPGTSTSNAPATSTTTTSTAPDTAPDTTTTTTTTTTLPPVVGEPQTTAFATDGYPASGSPGFLVTIRTESYDPFARIVFEFDEKVPEFALEYLDGPVLAAPSAQPIDVAGEAVLAISLAPATGVDLSGDQPVETYTGPERLQLDSSIVNELVQTEDFESHMTWVVGLDEVVPFSFSTLEDPARIVVDLHLSET